MTLELEATEQELISKAGRNTIHLHNGAHSLTVDPSLGGRITEFSIDGQNCLSTSAPLIGSTFWPSPQNSWGWPPPAALDVEPYEVAEVASGILLTSCACADTGLVVAKYIEPAHKGFCITYRMHNATDNSLKYAPWEISRIDGGLTFYRAGQQPQKQSNLTVDEGEGAFWHDYHPAGFDSNLKLFANCSEGWLANLNKGLLLKKSFPQVLPENVAPSEAEVEIYAHGDPNNPYIEIEQQGSYVDIAPGDSVDWQVLWQLVKLPHTTENGYEIARNELLRIVNLI